MRTRLVLLIFCAGLAASAAANETVSGSSAHVGGRITIDEAVSGSLHAAGGRITVDSPVGGSARLAGGRLEVGPNAVIGQDASLAGGSVEVKGSVKGNLHVGAGSILIDGPVGGDVSVAGGTLELGPNARIGGSLRFRGGTLKRDPAAQVAGSVEHAAGRSRTHDVPPFVRAAKWWIWTAGLMLLAGIIAAALPGASQRMTAELRARPWMAPLLGFIALTCIPVLAVLVMVTVIGIPLGLLALLAYAALLLVGYVFVSVVVGGLLLDRFKAEAAALWGWRAGAAVLSMLVIALLVRIPFIGGLFAFVTLLVGVGMIVAVILRRTPGAEPVAS